MREQDHVRSRCESRSPNRSATGPGSRSVSRESRQGLRCLFGLSALWLAAATAGCQSGRIGYIVTADQNRIIYSREPHGPLYITDERGTRSVRHPKGYPDKLLSANGRWLLTSDGDPRGDTYRRVGDRLMLFDLERDQTFDGALDFHIVSAPPGRVDYFLDYKGMPRERGDQPIEIARGPVPVFISDEPRVWFGPVDDKYLVWAPKEESNPWTRVAASLAQPDPQTATDHQLLEDDRRRKASPFVVELPYDGWNPRRTVWVRPDGKVIELARQDDVPYRISVQLLGPWNMGPVAGLAAPFVYAAAAPKVIAEQAKRDAEELVVAKQRLQRAVNLRRGGESPATQAAQSTP